MIWRFAPLASDCTISCWRCVNGKRTRKSSRAFEWYYDCVEDARSHGVSINLDRAHEDIASADLNLKIVGALRVTQSFLPLLPKATKDQKIALCSALSASRNEDVAPALTALSKDIDPDVGLPMEKLAWTQEMLLKNGSMPKPVDLKRIVAPELRAKALEQVK